MSKQKIFLFASEIAIITGHNPYQKPKKVIDRLISEYFPQLLEGQVTVPLDNREYIEYISKTNNIDISAELKATDNSKNTNELNKNRQKLLSKLENELGKKTNISKEIKAEVQKAAKSAVNTKFGTTYENCGITEYCRITGFPVTEDTRFRKYKLLETPDFDVYIGGRVDGLLIDPDTGKTVRVIEVKNRMNRLFKKLRDYEKVQCHIYMKLLDTKESDLIEIQKKGEDSLESSIITVDFNETFYTNEIEARIYNFINSFIEELNKN
jgi:hypothetical protein